MTKEDKLYIAGSIICLAGVGLIIFYAVKANKAEDVIQATARQNKSAQTASNPVVAGQQDIKPPNNTGDDTAISDPAANQNVNENVSSSDGSDLGHSHNQRLSMPASSKPFFGSVSAVSGNQITLNSKNNTAATVTLSDSTQFDGGTKDSIIAGVRIVGYGTANSDGSIAAVKIAINPTMPSGGRFNRNSSNQSQ